MSDPARLLDPIMLCGGNAIVSHDPTFKAGLVGAGYISEFHCAALRGLGDVEIVGIHDLDSERQAEAAERYEIPPRDSLAELVEAGANVIHVLTPPHAHARVTLDALEQGCHVLVEKPLAEDVEDCRAIAELAEDRGLSVCVDHTLLFDPQVRRALHVVAGGRLGRVVSVDLLRSTVFPPWDGGPLPPQYRKGGYPFRDQAVHAFSLFEAFLGPIEGVEARWASIGEGDPNLLYDEWSALVQCRDGVGRMGLSWNVSPMQNQLIVQGTRGVLRVDLFLMFHGVRRSSPLPKPAERLVNAVTDLGLPLLDVGRYVADFARGRVVPYQGLHDLVAAFYSSLATGDPPPVSVEDGTRIVRWVEQVARAADKEHAAATAPSPMAPSVDFLVTGASGNLGGRIVAELIRRGHTVRAMVRRRNHHLPPGIDVAAGDLGDPEAVERAVKGARVVIHAGAAMSGPPEDHRRGTVRGTANIVEAALRHGVEQVVHVSSLSVVDWTHDVVISETTPYEPRPEERGAYTQCKLEAERLVLDAAGSGFPVVVLRPGQIYGGAAPLLTPATARRAGNRWLVFGDGEVLLPLVHVDDVVQGVLTAVERGMTGGEVVHLVGEPLTQNEIIRREVPTDARVIRIPRRIVMALARVAQAVFARLGRSSPLTTRQVATVTSGHRFDASKARELLDWGPNNLLRDARSDGHDTGRGDLVA